MTMGETIRSYLALGKLKISFFACPVRGDRPSPGEPPSGRCAAGSDRGRFSPGLRRLLPESIPGASVRCPDGKERPADPFPRGGSNPAVPSAISLALIGSGSFVLFFTDSLAAPFLGLAAVLWYNGFYTWIKTRTAFAALPGALAGAIPPAIGWMAGGGSLGDPPLAVLCFFFFMWQVPHFFVHLLTFGTEYEAIGRPSLTAVFTGVQLGRLVFQWLFASAVSLQLIIIYGLIRSPFVRIALLTASFWLVARGILLLREGRPGYPRVFKELNYFMLAVMFLLFLEKLPRHLA